MEQFEFEGPDGEGYLYEAGLDPELEGIDGEAGYYEAALDPELEFESWSTSMEGGDLEADPFLGGLIRKATSTIARNVRSGVSPGLLKQLAQQAAQVAGAAVAGKTGANIASQIANQVLREGDIDRELEFEVDASMEVDSGLMEELHYNAAMAAESESEQEADQFIGAIASLAGPLLSNLLGESADPLYEGGFADGEGAYLGERDEFLPALIPFAAPLIGKGVRALGKVLSRNRGTRRLVRALPQVAAGTAKDLSRLRRPPTARDVAVALARRTARAVGSPTAVARTMRQNRAIAARAQGRPAYGGSAPRGSYATRRYPIYGGSRGRRRVVGYILRPVYAAPRARI
jgi:hypothetical protein